MKKSIILAMIAMLGFTGMQAQEFIIFGAKGGVNFTNMTSDSFDEKNSRTGFHLGLLAEIPVTSRFSFQPEVLYSTQGTETTGTVGNATWTGDFRADYIQVPVMAKFYIIDGLALEVGPSFNFLVEEDVTITGAPGSITSGTDVLRDFEFGGALGLSLRFARTFFASARYTQGFSDAFESSEWQGDSVYNNGFQLGIGLQF